MISLSIGIILNVVVIVGNILVVSVFNRIFFINNVLYLPIQSGAERPQHEHGERKRENGEPSDTSHHRPHSTFQSIRDAISQIILFQYGFVVTNKRWSERMTQTRVNKSWLKIQQCSLRSSLEKCPIFSLISFSL